MKPKQAESYPLTFPGPGLLPTHPLFMAEEHKNPMTSRWYEINSSRLCLVQDGRWARDSRCHSYPHGSPQSSSGSHHPAESQCPGGEGNSVSRHPPASTPPQSGSFPPFSHLLLPTRSPHPSSCNMAGWS